MRHAYDIQPDDGLLLPAARPPPGCPRSVHLMTRAGIYLNKVTTCSSWAWAVQPRPKGNYIAVGCEDGSIAMLQLIFATVHGLYGDRYVYRDLMTDVIIQHLITEQKVRIKCRQVFQATCHHQ
jgi:intraflagellar transport protein 122